MIYKCYDSNNNVLGVSKGNPSILNFYMQNSTGTFVLTVFLVLSVINTLFAIRMYIRMRERLQNGDKISNSR